jgi:hypothetical protein
VDFAFHSLIPKTEINESVASQFDVILVERIIEALIEVLQVKEDHGAAVLHADLDSVDVSANLKVDKVLFRSSRERIGC